MRKSIILLFLMASIATNAQTPEEKLKALGIVLPEVMAPIASYVNVVRTGNLLYLSGKGPVQADGKYVTGKLGKDMTIEEGYQAARLTAIIQIAVLKKELGNLSKVKTNYKSTGNGKLHRRFCRPTQSNQWLFRSDGGHFW